MTELSPTGKASLEYSESGMEHGESSHVKIIAERSMGKRLHADTDPLAASDQREIGRSFLHCSDVDTVRRTAKKPQRYRPQWEQHPSLKGWLAAVPGNPFRARCLRCSRQLLAQLKVLLDHSLCQKHVRRMSLCTSPPPPPSLPPLLLPTATASASASATATASATVQPISPVRADSGETSITLESQNCVGAVHLSTPLSDMTVGFIGAGKMAQALAMGLMNKGVVSAGRILVSATSTRNTDVWSCWKCHVVTTNAELVEQCDVVFVAVPPTDLASAVASLHSPLSVARARCFVSLVTGVSVDCLTEMLIKQMGSDSLAVVRCTVSRTVAIGEGVCVYFSSSPLASSWLLCIESALSSLGLCHRARIERHLDAYCGAFGGGVAFAAQFIDALATGAASQGIGWEEAVQMAAQTVQGTAAMVLSQGVMPFEVRRECCTPGGSTLAGLMALNKTGFEFSVMAAVEAATKKARELGSSV